MLLRVSVLVGIAGALTVTKEWMPVVMKIMASKMKTFQKDPVAMMSKMVPSEMAIPSSMWPNHGYYKNRLSDIQLRELSLGKLNVSSRGTQVRVRVPDSSSVSLSFRLRLCAQFIWAFGWRCIAPIDVKYFLDLEVLGGGTIVTINLSEPNNDKLVGFDGGCHIFERLHPNPANLHESGSGFFMKMMKAAETLLNMVHGDSKDLIFRSLVSNKGKFNGMTCKQIRQRLPTISRGIAAQTPKMFGGTQEPKPF